MRWKSHVSFRCAACRKRSTPHVSQNKSQCLLQAGRISQLIPVQLDIEARTPNNVGIAKTIAPRKTKGEPNNGRKKKMLEGGVGNIVHDVQRKRHALTKSVCNSPKQLVDENRHNTLAQR